MSKTLPVLAAAVALAAAASAAHAAAFSVAFTYSSPAPGFTSLTVNLVSNPGGGTDGSSNVTDVGGAEFDMSSNSGTGNSESMNLVTLFANTKKAKTGNTADIGAGSLDYFQFGSQEGAFDNSTATTAANLSDATMDSHFDFVYGAAKMSSNASGEPTDGSEQTVILLPGSSVSSATEFLSVGGFSITAQSRASVYTLAQLVYPSTNTDPIAYTISDLFGATLTGNIPAQAGVVTPEPASLGLLAVGGLALLARRKKTA
jgi:hypothetical protein